MTWTYRQEYRRCGKSSCTRCRDGRGHGPYWYGYTRDGTGKLHSHYFGKQDPRSEAPPPVLVTENSSARGPLPLHAWLFGGFRLEIGTRRIPDASWTRSSARRLAALLLLQSSPLSREEVCEQLWPEHDPDHGRTLLAKALSSLRSTLFPPSCRSTVSGGSGIEARTERLALAVNPDDWVDTREMGVARDPRILSTAELRSLVGLSSGELLPEYPFDEWAVRARDTFRMRRLCVLAELALRLRAEGRDLEALAYLRTILECDPANEAAAVNLMHIHAARGERAAALCVYETLRMRLATELGVAPAAETDALAEKIRHAPSCEDIAQSLDDSAVGLRRTLSALRERGSRPGTSGLVPLLARQTEVLARSGRTTEALSAVTASRLSLSDAAGPAVEARLLLSEAVVHSVQGNVAALGRVSDRADRKARQAGEDTLRGIALRLRAQAAQQGGQLQDALGLALESAAVLESEGLSTEALRSRRIAALCLSYLAKHADAEHLYRASLDLCSDPEQRGYILCGIGASLRAQGRLETAETHLRESEDLAVRMNDRFLLLSIRYHLAALWVDRATLSRREKDEQEARARLDASVALALTCESHFMALYAAVDLASALYEWGDRQPAKTALELAHDIHEMVPGHRPSAAWLSVVDAEAALTDGDPGTAARLILDNLALVKTAAPGALPYAYRIAALASPSQDAADDYWAVALNAARASAQPIERIRCERMMGRH